jgi:hypothetical protein
MPNPNAFYRREPFAFPPQESHSRANNAPQLLGQTEKVGCCPGANRCFERNARLRSYVLLPVQAASLNGDTNPITNARPDHTISCDTNTSGGIDAHRDLDSNARRSDGAHCAFDGDADDDTCFDGDTGR